MSDTKSSPVRGRPRTTDPQEVLEVAMGAYWQGDPADVSVNEICRLAGVSKPSVYREFGSEDGLALATIDRYAKLVLSDVLALLGAGKGMQSTLDDLTNFACDDPRMETGCLFYKMRNGKHRLGPMTRARIDELQEGAQTAYQEFLRGRREAGEWPEGPTVEAGARYLSEQVALAITQRSTGESPKQVREMLALALSVFVP